MTGAPDLVAACAACDPRALLEVEGASHLALMHPRDFLRLASPVSDRIDGAGRTATVRGLLDAGTPFASWPDLILDVEGERAFVMGHDGRHRAMELLERGCHLMPVVLTVEDTGEPDRDPAAAVAGLRVLHPQPHDEDDAYPGWDEEALEDRLEPVDARTVLVALVPFAEAVRTLLGAQGVPPGPGR